MKKMTEIDPVKKMRCILYENKIYKEGRREGV